MKFSSFWLCVTAFVVLAPSSSSNNGLLLVSAATGGDGTPEIPVCCVDYSGILSVQGGIARRLKRVLMEEAQKKEDGLSGGTTTASSSIDWKHHMRRLMQEEFDAATADDATTRNGRNLVDGDIGDECPNCDTSCNECFNFFELCPEYAMCYDENNNLSCCVFEDPFTFDELCEEERSFVIRARRRKLAEDTKTAPSSTQVHHHHEDATENITKQNQRHLLDRIVGTSLCAAPSTPGCCYTGDFRFAARKLQFQLSDDATPFCDDCDPSCRACYWPPTHARDGFEGIRHLQDSELICADLNQLGHVERRRLLLLDDGFDSGVEYCSELEVEPSPGGWDDMCCIDFGSAIIIDRRDLQSECDPCDLDCGNKFCFNIGNACPVANRCELFGQPACCTDEGFVFTLDSILTQISDSSIGLPRLCPKPPEACCSSFPAVPFRVPFFFDREACENKCDSNCASCVYTLPEFGQPFLNQDHGAGYDIGAFCAFEFGFGEDAEGLACYDEQPDKRPCCEDPLRPPELDIARINAFSAGDDRGCKFCPCCEDIPLYGFDAFNRERSRNLEQSLVDGVDCLSDCPAKCCEVGLLGDLSPPPGSDTCRVCPCCHDDDIPDSGFLRQRKLSHCVACPTEIPCCAYGEEPSFAENGQPSCRLCPCCPVDGEDPDFLRNRNRMLEHLPCTECPVIECCPFVPEYGQIPGLDCRRCECCQDSNILKRHLQSDGDSCDECPVGELPCCEDLPSPIVEDIVGILESRPVCRACDGPDGKDGGAGGDPHVKTWASAYYDFHGECDGVLLSAPSFANGTGLIVHARMTERFGYSFIESVAVCIGYNKTNEEDLQVLEVTGFGEYLVGGVSGATMPATLTDSYVVTHHKVNEHSHAFTLDLGNKQTLELKTWKDWVSFSISSATKKDFGDSVGMMGSYKDGALLARDGKTVIEDPVEFGKHWQVRDTEPSLFQAVREPQYPQACRMPDPVVKEGRRRLLAQTVSQEEAEEACAHHDEDHQPNCVYDVLASGDLDAAQAGAF